MAQHIKLYHGTNQYFEKFDQSKARLINDYYGGGVAYFTDTMDVAKTYANAMVKKNGGERYVYEVTLTINKLFDVDKQIPTNELTQIFKTREDIESFARGANLLRPSVDKFQVLSKLSTGELILTGDEVFKGLSRGMNQTAKARDTLKRMRYDTLRYNGVNMGGGRHNVYITYNASNVHINKHYMIDKDGHQFMKH